LGAVHKALREETEKHGRTIALLEAFSEKSIRTPTIVRPLRPDSSKQRGVRR
jgi:hypothetical protein